MHPNGTKPHLHTRRHESHALPKISPLHQCGSGIWNLLLLALGKKAEAPGTKSHTIFDQYSAAILTLTIAITILYIAYKLSTTKKKD